MKLIIGLGNPGGKYGGTRHNVGFMIVDQFLKDYEQATPLAWSENTKIKSQTVLLEWQPHHGQLEKIILLKPLTYMNNSGMAISLATSYFKISPSDVWIINDELDLPLGSMKIRFGGAAAGHHGVESIINSLGTDKFWRFRMGIGVSHQSPDRNDGAREHPLSSQKMHDVEKYVLGSFSGKERAELKKLVKRGSDALQTALEKGMESAMNRFNTK